MGIKREENSRSRQKFQKLRCIPHGLSFLARVWALHHWRCPSRDCASIIEEILIYHRGDWTRRHLSTLWTFRDYESHSYDRSPQFWCIPKNWVNPNFPQPKILRVFWNRVISWWSPNFIHGLLALPCELDSLSLNKSLRLHSPRI